LSIEQAAKLDHLPQAINARIISWVQEEVWKYDFSNRDILHTQLIRFSNHQFYTNLADSLFLLRPGHLLATLLSLILCFSFITKSTDFRAEFILPVSLFLIYVTLFSSTKHKQENEGLPNDFDYVKPILKILLGIIFILTSGLGYYFIWQHLQYWGIVGWPTLFFLASAPLLLLFVKYFSVSDLMSVVLSYIPSNKPIAQLLMLLLMLGNLMVVLICLLLPLACLAPIILFINEQQTISIPIIQPVQTPVPISERAPTLEITALVLGLVLLGLGIFILATIDVYTQKQKSNMSALKEVKEEKKKTKSEFEIKNTLKQQIANKPSTLNAEGFFDHLSIFSVNSTVLIIYLQWVRKNELLKADDKNLKALKLLLEILENKGIAWDWEKEWEEEFPSTLSFVKKIDWEDISPKAIDEISKIIRGIYERLN